MSCSCSWSSSLTTVPDVEVKDEDGVSGGVWVWICAREGTSEVRRARVGLSKLNLLVTVDEGEKGAWESARVVSVGESFKSKQLALVISGSAVRAYAAVE